MTRLTESTVEDATLEWLEAIGWHVVHGPPASRPVSFLPSAAITARWSSPDACVMRLRG